MSRVYAFIPVENTYNETVAILHKFFDQCEYLHYIEHDLFSSLDIADRVL